MTRSTQVAVAGSVIFSAYAWAGPDRVKFPADYNKGVLYATVDRHDNKQVRELYTSPEAVKP